MVFALGAPALAVVTDQLPRRTVVVIAQVMFAAANAAAAVAPGYWFLMGARVVAALAASLVASASFVIAAGAAPEGKQGRYLAVVTAGLTVALFTGVPIGTLLGGAYGWRATFWLVAAVGATVALGLRITAPHIAGSRSAPLAQRLAPLRSGPVARLVGTMFLCGSGGLMFYSYLGPVTAEFAGGGYQLRSLLLLLVGLAGVGAVFLGGRVTDAWGSRPARLVIIGGHSLALLGLAAYAFTGTRNPIIFTGLVALWSLFAWALNPPMQASMLSAAPGSAMTALALNISGLYLGTGFAAALGGVVLSVAGVAFIPLVAGLLLLGAVGMASGRPDRCRDDQAGSMPCRRISASSSSRAGGSSPDHNCSSPAKAAGEQDLVRGSSHQVREREKPKARVGRGSGAEGMDDAAGHEDEGSCGARVTWPSRSNSATPSRTQKASVRSGCTWAGGRRPARGTRRSGRENEPPVVAATALKSRLLPPSGQVFTATGWDHHGAGQGATSQS